MVYDILHDCYQVYKNMQKYILMANWIAQGRKTLQETPERIEKTKNLKKELNNSINHFTL